VSAECFVEFYENFIVAGVGVVGLLRLVFEICFAVVERIVVDVMTDIAESCPGDESVHRDIDLLSVFENRCFCVERSFVLDGSPCELRQGKVSP